MEQTKKARTTTFANPFSGFKSLVAPDGQTADFVELFFDLVFVYAITRITHLTAEHLDIEHVLKSVLIFWLIWWAWSQYTWTLNAADTKSPEIRLGTLIVTAVTFVMASAIDQAFDDGVMWFAIPYIAIKALGMALYIRVTPSEDDENAAVARMAGLTVPGLAAVFGGALADPSQRVWWWLAAIILDMISGFIAGRFQGWRMRVEHFTERHGLIVIVALGESLIVAASAIQGEERSADLLISGGLAVLVTCLLWWSYFAWIREHLEEQLTEKSGSERARLGRDVFSFMHFPLIFGIIGIAVGFEKIVSHPHDPLTLPIVAALGGGVVLFVAFTAAAVWRSSRSLLIPRIGILTLTSAALVLTIDKDPKYALGLIAGGLFLIDAIEWKKCRRPLVADR